MARLRDDELEKQLEDSNAAPISIPLDFLKAITLDFSNELELGRGGYGVVYKGLLRSGKIIAVKKLFDLHILDDKTFRNEVISVMEIKHQHVVRFIGYCAETSWETIKLPSGNIIWAESPKRLLCFEYLCNKSLGKYISDKSLVLEWNMRYEIIKGICSGLNFLHEGCHIVHLDLKPENILMDATMIPKIADFGLSRIFASQQSRIITHNRAGSHGYMAPEYLLQGLISKKADIFSMGVIIIEIVTGHRDYPYFQLDSPQSTATSCQHFIEKVLGSWRNNFKSSSKYISMEKYIQQVKQCITIALKCVNPDMEKRPIAKDIVQVLNAVDQMEAKKEFPSEMQYKGKSFVLDTTVSKELILHSITEDMSNIETDGTVGDLKKCKDYLLPTPLWTSTTDSQTRQDISSGSNEPQKATDKTSEMEAHQELRPDKQCTNKLLVLNTTSSKDLIPQNVIGEMFVNETDGKLKDKAECYESLSPASTSSESSIGIQNCQEGSMQRQAATQMPISYEIKIISAEYVRDLFAIDANPIEQLIITASANVHIWNYGTQKLMGSIETPRKTNACCTRFIARKGWFLIGSGQGFIHVYNYRKEMQEITSFRAHSSGVRSVAIHPTKSYVLSANTTVIKLWSWGHRWKCMQTFDAHSEALCSVAFNPEDYSSFAGVSVNSQIKIWSLDSTECKYSLSGHSHNVRCLDFFARDGQQYLITASRDKTAKIWDMQTKECVRTLPHRSEVQYVLPHPKFPLLITGTQSNQVYFWSSTNFRLEKIIDIGGCSDTGVRGLACLNESGRVAVAHWQGVEVVEIRDEEEGQGGSKGNDEDSISTTD